jgi:hypothetical protein
LTVRDNMHGKANRRAERDKRLAEALRANLKRRKAAGKAAKLVRTGAREPTERR